MKIHQLSLFLENRPSQLRAVCKLLADAGINLMALSLADSEQFGILRLIVRDWQQAKTILEVANRLVKITEVVAIEVPDRPGGLDDVLAVIEQHEINIAYMYAFTFGLEKKAALIFRFDNADDAIGKLQSSGVNVLGRVELFEQAET
jgi:hypothetical protein